jgi:catechol 2,3-dioxygenase
VTETIDEGSPGGPSRLIDHIESVDLRVRSIDGSVAFYRDRVGLRVVEQGEGRALLAAPGGRVLLGLSSEGVDAPAERSATGLFHTAIRYPDRRSLADALARLVAGGYRIGAGDHGVSEALYIDDPDGNGVELYRDRPREQWPAPGPGERVRMYTEPVDLDALLAESGGGSVDEAPPRTEIGHVHLQVSDVPRTVAFYVDGLGLDLMAMFGSQAAFMSSNGYHHHVGANSWNSRGRRPAPKKHAGLERVVFFVEDSEALGRASDRLSGTDRPLELGDGGGRVRDPDNIELRFTAPSLLSQS